MSFSRSKDYGWNSSSYDIKKNADIEKVIFAQRQKLSKLEQELEEERITKEKEYVDYQEKANLEYAWRIKQEETLHLESSKMIRIIIANEDYVTINFFDSSFSKRKVFYSFSNNCIKELSYLL